MPLVSCICPEKSPSPVYGARLELVYGLIAHRGFESLLLRHKAEPWPFPLVTLSERVYFLHGSLICKAWLHKAFGERTAAKVTPAVKREGDFLLIFTANLQVRFRRDHL